jgi:hypothetical protein
MLIVGTRAHLEDLDRSYTYAQDVLVNSVAVGTFYGGVGSLLPGMASPVWSLFDNERIVSLGEFDLTPVVRLPAPGAQCLAAGATGVLLVGLPGAHLMTVSSGGSVQQLPAFDQLPGRDTWTNPAAALPEIRSIAISQADVWYVNVHVGGLWRSEDQGGSWHCVVPPESDVHEVVTGDGTVLAVAAAIGFGWSCDGGDSWQWTTEGLHASYARAVALDGDNAYVTASTGPETTDGRLYRASIGQPFQPCTSGLPESFPFNLDTGSVTARGGQVALGTRNGHVFRSNDSGSSFDVAAEGMRPVRVVRFS